MLPLSTFVVHSISLTYLFPSSGNCLVVITFTNSTDLSPLFLLYFMLHNSTVMSTSPSNSTEFSVCFKLFSIWTTCVMTTSSLMTSLRSAPEILYPNKLISKHVYHDRWDNCPHHPRRDSPACHHITARCRYTQFHQHTGPCHQPDIGRWWVGVLLGS